MLCASPADDLQAFFITGTKNVAAETGFYWGTDTAGVPHHQLEKVLTLLESNATPAFRRVLDSGKRLDDDALPPWPPKVDTRVDIAWWLAAQILRTVRQRQRLELTKDDSIAIPSTFDSSNRHIRYIAEMIEPLAATLLSRPWGVGFADACLLTGDVPVLVLNGQDHDDQNAAVAFWDVYVPLDPHRCLYLPGVMARERNRRLNSDHRFKIHPGICIGLNAAVAEVAVRHVFFHPDHDARRHLDQRNVIRKRDGKLPHFLLWSDALEPEFGIERRWLEMHPPDRDPDEMTAEPKSNEEILKQVQLMTGELDAAKDAFGRIVGPHR